MRWRESFSFLWNVTLLSIPVGNRIDRLYRTLGENNSLCDTSQFLNLGYWEDDTNSLDEASRNLADLMAKEGRFFPGASLLDVGCGFGAQDFQWLEDYDLGKVAGINISATQLQKAQALATEAAIGKIKFVFADATQIPAKSESFDFVTALESAFHFRHRRKFFNEAFRVLKPGGRLVLADLAGREEAIDFGDRLAQFFGRHLWQIPKSNLIPLDTYIRQLEDVGFDLLKAYSIWDQVHPPFRKFALKKLECPKTQARLNPVYSKMLKASLHATEKRNRAPMDYVLIVMQKPKEN